VKVTLVAHDVGGVGGMERHLRELVDGLAARGIDVTVISRTCDVGASDRVRWIRVRGPGRPFPLAFPWFALAGGLLLALRGGGVRHATGAIVPNRVDVATVHLCHHAVAGRPEMRRRSRLTQAHALNARLAAALARAGERWVYRPRRARRLVAVSNGVAGEVERFLGFPRERLDVIPNGVDTEAFHPAAGGHDGAPPLTALFVGGGWDGKGLDLAIEAVAADDRWRLVVVGAGDERRYAELAESLGAGTRVEFAGARQDVAAWYRRADAFVLPSAYETFSLVTYEAAASGLPLLVTRVSGVEEILRDGENGWFVSRDAADVAWRLGALADDPGLRERMGRVARESSLRFGWDAMVDAYVATYGRTMSAN
jgi:glycosyltransferase involved in cell wall biosynthesis